MPVNLAGSTPNPKPKKTVDEPIAEKEQSTSTTDDETLPDTSFEDIPAPSPSVKRPGISRRALAIGAVAIIGATGVGIAARMLKTDPLPPVDDADKPASVNKPGKAPKDAVDAKRTYTVGENIDAGLYTVNADTPDKGWMLYGLAMTDGRRSWPAVNGPVSVTVSMQDGDMLEVAEGVSIKEAAKVTDLAEIPAHAGLFLVGTDIAEGTYLLEPMSVDEWCSTEFGAEAPVDVLHPTLWHKTCARAASATRAAGIDVSTWCGYIAAEPQPSGDVGATLDDTGAADLNLLTADEVVIDTDQKIDGRMVDNYLVWMENRGFTPITEATEVKLKAGQVFAPVMCTVKHVK